MPKIYKDDITYFGFGVGVGGKYLYTRMIAKKLKTEIFFKKKKNQSIKQKMFLLHLKNILRNTSHEEEI